MFDIAIGWCGLPFVKARHDVCVGDTSRSRRHDVVLVVQREVIENVGINFAAAYFGLGDLGYAVLANAAQLAITLPYSRGHETDADLVGLELAARAGFDPRAAVSLWRKMAAATQGQPPQFLSTHPGHAQRIQEIERTLPRVLPLYETARR